MTKNFRVAVTGGIATGKSTVMAQIRSRGFQTASADEEARRAFGTDSVQRELGRILEITGPVTREVLRSRILESSDTRKRVNRVFHGMVLDSLLNSGATFFEIPLLFESVLWSQFDRVWVTSCPAEVQIARITERGVSAQEAEGFLSAQAHGLARIALADAEIRTNQPIDSVTALVDRLLEPDHLR